MVSRFGTFIGGACLAISAAFFVIACASNNWVNLSSSDPSVSNVYVGLWDACVGGVNTDCASISKDSDCSANIEGQDGNIFEETADPSGDCEKFNGVRAMSVLAVIFTAAGAVFAIFLVAIADNTNHRYLTLLLALVGLTCGMIAMALFVKLYNALSSTSGTGEFHLGYSFILNTIAWPFGLYGCIHFGWSAMLAK